MTMKLILTTTVLLMAATTLPASSASAEDVYTWTGVYGKLGVSMGFPAPDASNVDDPNIGVGFDLAEGLRLNSWLATEVGLNYIAGADVNVGALNYNLSVFSSTLTAKIYPLGVFDLDAIPSWIQPYGAVGLGGGMVKYKSKQNSNLKQGSFMVRYGGGLDLFPWDHVGFYLDGGYLQITNEDTGLKGGGQVMIGVAYRM